ncbi:MAG: hypothetical protein LBK18_07905 [Prevotellaceae bacterium]|jgi:hypothetical protein|nr:hypothetical protein [Prevotellaceae bacterium]MDR1343158.1 hypothetical protein [Prevotellaceae bacterium]
METKYTYKGEDITLDMMFKIEHIATILAKREHKNFDAAFVKFLSSATYRALQQTDNTLWAESSEYIADDYQREELKVKS